MEEWIEIEGRSKEDAIERACDALNTTRAFLRYEVLGGNGSKIRARKVEEDEQPKKEVSREGARESVPDEADSDEDRSDEVRSDRAQSDEPPSDIGQRAEEYLKEILRHIEEDAQVTLYESGDSIDLDIEGNGSGLLIGKHGQTLDALQHLVTKMVGLDRTSGKRLAVDAEQYRARRKESLEGLARKTAERVRRQGRPASLEPMNPLDRRTLHMALADETDIVTKSVGDGLNRKVMICPKNGGRSRSRSRSTSGRGGSRGRGGYRDRGRSDQRSDGRGNERSNERSNGRSDQRTDGRGNERSNGRSDQRTDGRGNERPSGRGGERPSGRGGERPSGRGGERPSGRDGERPSGRDGERRTGPRGNRRTEGPTRGRGPTRRRSGPPPRMHDNFDVPAQPKDDIFEDPDAPRVEDIESGDFKLEAEPESVDSAPEANGVDATPETENSVPDANRVDAAPETEDNDEIET